MGISVIPKMAAALCILRLCLMLLLWHGRLVICQEKKLRMVNLVYRHGDRSPIHIFPTDKHEGFWPQGLGQLTEIGMKQEFHLGEFLKQRYINETTLLNSSYIKNQVYCRSSDRDRTIMSAQTQLNGLYPPNGRQVWRNTLDWQPIPVHTVPMKDDYLLRPLDYDCPRYKDAKRESLNKPKYKKVEADHKGFMKWVSLQTGMNVTVGNAWIVHDVLFCEKQHNLSIPSWVNETVMERLSNISSFSFEWSFASAEKARLSGGPLLGEMVDHMKSFRDGKKGLREMYIYSAHDTTMAALLSALKLYDGTMSPYSSALMVELYSSDERNDLSVQIRYRFGQSNDLLHLKLKNCDRDCPLESFLKETASAIPTDLDKECGRSSATKEICVKTIVYRGFLTAFIVVTVLFVFLLVFLCVRWRIRHSRQQKSLLMVRGGLLKDARLLDNSDYDSEA